MARQYYSNKGSVVFSVPTIRQEMNAEGRMVERLGSYDVVIKDAIYATMKEIDSNKLGRITIDPDTKEHKIRYYWFSFNLNELRDRNYNVLDDKKQEEARSFFYHKAAAPKIAHGELMKAGSPDDSGETIQTTMADIYFREVPEGTPGSISEKDVQPWGRVKELPLPAIDIPLQRKRGRPKIKVQA